MIIVVNLHVNDGWMCYCYCFEVNRCKFLVIEYSLELKLCTVVTSWSVNTCNATLLTRVLAFIVFTLSLY